MEYVEFDGRWWGCEWVWLATPSGGRRGSSAEGQGDCACLNSGYMVCVSSWMPVPYFSSFLRDGELEKCAQSIVALGIWTLRYEPLAPGSSCSLSGCALLGAMLGSTRRLAAKAATPALMVAT